MALKYDLNAEWLEADGQGGFASGTVSGIRTRRYHAFLLPATTPPTGRFVLVNGFDAWVETPKGRFAITSQAYGPDTIHPDGSSRIDSFTTQPWPSWAFALEDGTKIAQELFVAKGAPVTVIRWKLSKGRDAKLFVRPFLSGRDYHSLHHENGAFNFEAAQKNGRVSWDPYPGVPGIRVFTNGAYSHEPLWFRNFLYSEERARGLDHAEDLASPGIFQWDLADSEAVFILGAQGPAFEEAAQNTAPETLYRKLSSQEKQRRAKYSSELLCSADAYIVERGEGKTIIAGYPWFTDWGRDTFIAMRGLCLAAGRLDVAHSILLEWAGAVSQGMLPNLFVDRGAEPEFNSVDASLWYLIAVYEFFQASEKAEFLIPKKDKARLWGAVESIVAGYMGGTRFGIQMDQDGLLKAGVPGVQLTWMDAKVGDWVVTPRIGKPVEIQALWINALWIASAVNPKLKSVLDKALRSFGDKFWNEEAGCLYDVIDVNHEKDKKDPSFRPNQIFAVGGLPRPLLEGEKALSVVGKVEEALWTPLGLRSLAPGSAEYAGRYQGGVRERDGAYHQGTVWPWLTGAFVEAWLRVYGNTKAKKSLARKKFIEPLLQHLEKAGIGHVSEIADADVPQEARGCPFQAWSLGELIRLESQILDHG